MKEGCLYLLILLWSAQERVREKELLTWPFNGFDACITTDSSTPSWTVNLQFTHQIQFLSLVAFFKLVLLYLKHYALETREGVYLAQTRSHHKFQDGNKDRHREALFHLTICLENQSIPEKLLLFQKCAARILQGGRMGYSNPKYIGSAKLGKKASRGKQRQSRQPNF